MDITITVSEKTAELIQHKAEENGLGIAEFVGEFVEENLIGENGEKRERKHNLLAFAGMFSGGDGKTSENYKQILRDEINSADGFTLDRKKD